MAPPLKQQIYKILTKKHGLTLQTDAVKYLATVVEDLPPEELVETLNYIATSYIQHEDGGRILVDRASLETTVDSIFRKAAINQAIDMATTTATITSTTHGGLVTATSDQQPAPEITLADISAYLHVIDSFQLPRWRFTSDNKGFVRVPEHQMKLLAPAQEKVNAYRDRFDLIRERLLRHDSFRAKTYAKRDETLEIMPIKNLQGHKPGDYLLFGMLTQVEEGRYHLEDPDALIELELNNVARGIGLYTLNCFLLVEGYYTEERKFRVRTLGMPLAEQRQRSLAAFGHNVNFFGGPVAGDEMVVLETVESKMTDVMFVIVSDVWLDQPRVVMKLRQLFEGFSGESSVRPLAFIFIGSFISTPYIYDIDSAAAYKDCWNTLADLLADFKEIAQSSHFIFVPGPNDPWNANILPRPHVPDHFTARVRQRVPNAKFVSNPCRIRYCTQEIVVFREDLVNRMRRNCIVAPSEEVPMEQHLIATIVEQAHLCPLPISVRPAYWAYDHALRIYPTPHMLVLADRYDSYAETYEGCQAINPGPFPSGFGFMVYWPADKKTQMSKILD
ncbi:DNA polymerase epsilon subunit 2 [Thoreauomyces humboldtii]|nr:DNA polymerase epsilon subunit 2 [Thoreauomyces humboldtii]